MATTVSLRWLDIYDSTSDDSLNLLAGDPNATPGWHIEKWVQEVASPDQDGVCAPVVEKMTCLVIGTDTGDLADRLRKISDFGDYARHSYDSPSAATLVYISYLLDGEPNHQRGYVRNITYKILEPLTDACGYIEKHSTRVKVEITREPYWEDGSYNILTKDALAAAASVCFDYRYDGVDIPGDAPTRMWQIRFLPRGASDHLGRIWAGIRSERHTPGCLYSRFQNIWEAEDGTNNAAESGITDDPGTDPNGASPGSAAGIFVKLIPADLTWDDTWHEVYRIEISDMVTANAHPQEQYGLLKWLLRTMVTSGEWQVQLKFGYRAMADDDFVENDIVDITNTSWDYYDMGQRSIPLRDVRAPIHPFSPIGTADVERGYTVQVWARRTSGTGNLYLDCLCPIPMDEGYFIASGFDADQATGDLLIYTETPLNTSSCVLYDGTNLDIAKWVEYDSDSFNFVPAATGYLVIVYARESTSDLTDLLTYYGLYTSRWFALREG